VDGPVASISLVAPIDAKWTQEATHALVHGRGERVQSDNVEMSAMMAVLKLCRVRQDTLSIVLEDAGKGNGSSAQVQVACPQVSP
jgi:hypothetical protein